MGLVACKECKANISSSADKCPHCGKPQQTNIGCLPTLAILFAVAWGISQFTGENRSPEAKRAAAARAALPPPPVPVRSPQDEIPVECRIAIEKVLNDPDSAEFLDRLKPVRVESVEGIGYRTWQRVRAKNAFGGKVVSTFQCEFLALKNSYKLTSIKELR